MAPLQAQWFVVQTLSGQEFKVRDSLLKRRVIEGLEERVVDVQVPTEKVSEVRQGRRITLNRKFFPGYLLVQASLYDDAGKIDQAVWYFIRQTQGVIGFLGGEKPAPLSPEEIEAIFVQTTEGAEAPKPKVDFEVGETVTIKNGAFENFEGVIESVDPERGRLRLSVTIFGRSTPVEVEYWQVERG
ncbi:MAG: transcription termination/antitermination factor NusG [Kiritimatiellaeota bacterium]|nr:transcription termination/antitermination factor NusG [Kiritimatiellota bacterium]